MNPIKVYYSAKHLNLGDAANPFILDKLFHLPLIRAHYKDAELFPVGSILGKVMTPFWALPERVKGAFQKKAVIWTSGFLEPPSRSAVCARKLKITALRGKRSLAVMEKILSKKIEVPLGDGGLFFPLLLDSLPEKKYTLGIVPHYREILHSSEPLRKLSALYPEAKMISPEASPGEPPREAVKRILAEIASCETILSSSLHGMIAADAFGIPNRHFINEKLTGGLFKFHDYRSAFGLEDSPLPLGELLQQKDPIEKLMKQHQISKDQTAEIRAKLTTIDLPAEFISA